ncbi:MAG: acetolactate synthase small subunit [Halothiobacillus sp.]
MRHIISILMENEAGALSRVAGLFSARGYNIESLCVAPTVDETLSRMTLVTRGDEQIIEQIIKQLNKLIDVVKVQDMADAPHIERELMLIKVQALDNSRNEVYRLAEIFRGQIIDVSESSYTIQMVGPGHKLDAFLNALGAIPVVEIVRSGALGIARGPRGMAVPEA